MTSSGCTHCNAPHRWTTTHSNWLPLWCRRRTHPKRVASAKIALTTLGEVWLVPPERRTYLDREVVDLETLLFLRQEYENMMIRTRPVDNITVMGSAWNCILTASKTGAQSKTLKHSEICQCGEEDGKAFVICGEDGFQLSLHDAKGGRPNERLYSGFLELASRHDVRDSRVFLDRRLELHYVNRFEGREDSVFFHDLLDPIRGIRPSQARDR